MRQFAKQVVALRIITEDGHEESRLSLLNLCHDLKFTAVGGSVQQMAACYHNKDVRLKGFLHYLCWMPGLTFINWLIEQDTVLEKEPK